MNKGTGWDTSYKASVGSIQGMRRKARYNASATSVHCMLRTGEYDSQDEWNHLHYALLIICIFYVSKLLFLYISTTKNRYMDMLKILIYSIG